ncbi:MAG TPA: PepSY domain-containing protein [Candidatus Kapabacteria bacterium]|nr:PepSY domain-containing protein [Candidatus Kapabacteria bacterium]
MKLTCPQCSAENQVDIPDAFARCEFCKSTLYIDIDEITVVYSFTPIVQTQQLGMFLKRDFDKTGFNEAIKVQGSALYYFPFWQVGGSDKLEKACSRFPGEQIRIPAGEKIFFDPAGALEKNIETLSIDTQPGMAQKRTLYYIPFYQVDIMFNRNKYTFYIDAVTGAVSGSPIPYFSAAATYKLFLIFMALFLLLLVINSVFANMLIVIPLCLATMAVFYRLSLARLEKK